MTNSFPNQYNLVCANSNYKSHVYSVNTLGSIFGTPVFGYLSDRIGRRSVLIFLLFVYLLSSLSPTLVKEFYTFMAFRFLNGLSTSVIYQIPFIMVMEIVAPAMRTWVNLVLCMSWAIGLCVLPLAAYLSRSWVWLNATAIAVAVGLIFMSR